MTSDQWGYILASAFVLGRRFHPLPSSHSSPRYASGLAGIFVRLVAKARFFLRIKHGRQPAHVHDNDLPRRPS